VKEHPERKNPEEKSLGGGLGTHLDSKLREFLISSFIRIGKINMRDLERNT